MLQASCFKLQALGFPGFRLSATGVGVERYSFRMAYSLNRLLLHGEGLLEEGEEEGHEGAAAAEVEGLGVGG